MHSERLYVESENSKGDAVTNIISPHKAFVEKLRRQAAFESITDADAPIALSNDSLYSEELMKELEVKFDTLFANLDDD